LEIIKRKIGVLGGSFDPVHSGHLMIACSLQEAHQLDAVYFVPTNINPLKAHILEESVHRVRMLQIALQGTGFAIKTLELERPAPSYMIDTVKILMAQEEAHYFLLMGTDLLQEITQWRSYRELFDLAPPLIAARDMQSINNAQWQHDVELKKLIESGITNTPLFDISSTSVRHRLVQGLFCGHLLDRGVYQYIKQHRLYGCS